MKPSEKHTTEHWNTEKNRHESEAQVLSWSRKTECAAATYQSATSIEILRQAK